MVILYIHAKLFIEFCIGLGAMNLKKKKENISEENRAGASMSGPYFKSAVSQQTSYVRKKYF